MVEIPSWKTSTLSQMVMICMIVYLAGCGVLIAGGGWKGNKEVLMVGYNGLFEAFKTVVIAYFVRMLPSMKQENGQVKPEEKPSAIP